MSQFRSKETSPRSPQETCPFVLLASVALYAHVKPAPCGSPGTRAGLMPMQVWSKDKMLSPPQRLSLSGGIFQPPLAVVPLPLSPEPLWPQSCSTWTRDIFNALNVTAPTVWQALCHARVTYKSAERQSLTGGCPSKPRQTGDPAARVREEEPKWEALARGGHSQRGLNPKTGGREEVGWQRGKRKGRCSWQRDSCVHRS